MFSIESLVLQLSYALLVVAVLAGTLQKMRMLIAASALVALIHTVFLKHHYTEIGWLTLLLGAWLAVLWADRQERRKARFTPVEEVMRQSFLAALPAGAARQFIDQGLWLTGAPGERLTHEGEPVANLYYLASGEARATVQGHPVGVCRAGDLVGEATILSGDAATATVTLTAPSSFWCASTPALRRFLDDHEGLRSAIERSFANALKEKLHAANRALATVERIG